MKPTISVNGEIMGVESVNATLRTVTIVEKRTRWLRLYNWLTGKKPKSKNVSFYLAEMFETPPVGSTIVMRYQTGETEDIGVIGVNEP